MKTSVHQVAREIIVNRPPPRGETGLINWLRETFFSSWTGVPLTIIGLSICLAFVYSFLNFTLFEATFIGATRDACLVNDGACWPYMYQFFHQLIYGNYTLEERWRVDLVAVVGLLGLCYVLAESRKGRRTSALIIYAVLLVAYATKVIADGYYVDSAGTLAFSGFDATPSETNLYMIGGLVLANLIFELFILLEKGTLNSALMLIGYPVFALILLTGGDFELDGFSLWGLFPETGTDVFWIEFVVAAASIIGFTMFLVFLTGVSPVRIGLGMVVAALCLAVLLALLDYDFGLSEVRVHLWGGMLLTLVIAVTGIVTSLPFGILLALGRRSQMPIIRLFSIVFIEFWRGVPLITVLFMATYMIPLFLPEGTETPEGIVNVLIGVSLFSSAYMAEVVRGGLQAIPKGQYEGAMALGLSYNQIMRMIILPQALKLVIPGIVNTFIGLFKDTTLVSIVSLADILGVTKRTFTFSEWATPTQAHTGYIVLAVIFFIFCFSMSRYSIYMERKLNTGHKR